MVQLYLLRTTLLRTQVSNTPVSFLSQHCRYKSITAAIERGKHQSDTFAGSRRGDDRGRRARPDRFGPPKSEYRGSNGDFKDPRPPREFGARESRPPRDFNASRESKPTRDYNGSRDSEPWESTPSRDFAGSRDSRPPRNFGESRGSRDFNRPRESRQPRDFNALRESRPSRDFDGSRDSRSSKDFGGPRESRPPRDFNGARESRPSRDFNASRESRPPREQREWNPSNDYPKKDRSSFNFTDTDSHNARTDHQSLESLPYTTAASEFLYGYSTVLAAIKANRRRLYTLYIHTRGLNHDRVGSLLARARAIRLNIREVDDKYLRAMDKASSGRPHNGFILEASPLPQLPITEMGAASIDGHFKVELDKQSAEDTIVNGTQTDYDYKSAGWRHPLLLYVDGVLDEGNLGAIARSAYFLGVDAIATPTRQSAPWSHIALKASAGAAEAIPIFTINQPADFLGKSAREGWRIYASDAVPAEETRVALTTATTPLLEVSTNYSSNVVYTFARSTRRLPHDHCPVAAHPTILMMGAEGAGLRSGLLNQAHYKVGIRHGRETDEVGVDSLNVSVAASLLCYEMLQKPQTVRKPGDWLF